MSGLLENTWDRSVWNAFKQDQFKVIQSEAILGQVAGRLGVSHPAAILKSRMSLRPVNNTTLVDISFTSESSPEAVVIANAIVEAYQRYWVDRVRELKTSGLISLEERVGEQEQRIRVANEKIERLEKELASSEFGPLNPESPYDDHGARSLYKVEIEAKQKYEQLTNALLRLNALSREQLREVLPGQVPDTVLKDLFNELQWCRSTLLRAVTNGGDDQLVTVERLKTTAKDLERRLDDRTSEVMKELALEERVLTAKSRLDELNSTRVNAQRRSQIERPYWDAKRELEDMQDFLRLLKRKIKVAEDNLLFPESTPVEIVERAVLPMHPISPNGPIKVALVMASLLAGVAAIGFGVLLLRRR